MGIYKQKYCCDSYPYSNKQQLCCHNSPNLLWFSFQYIFNNPVRQNKKTVSYQLLYFSETSFFQLFRFKQFGTVTMLI